MQQASTAGWIRLAAGRSAPSPDPHLLTFVELLFFAYRDFTREADAVLAEFGLGRAHHRVLHFVNRHPACASPTCSRS